MIIVCPSCQAKNRVPEDKLTASPACGQCHQGLIPLAPIELNEQNFSQFVTGSDLPILIDLWADWCGPCAAVRRVVHQVLADRTDAREVELDIDAHPVLARELGVLSLPTTFVLDGELRRRSRIAGVPSAAALREALDAL